MKTFEMDRYHMGRLAPGGDLLEAIESLLAERGIRAGYLWALGAVRRGAVGFFDQKTQEYRTISLDEPMEILACQGNISVKDGRPFPHVHITFGDSRGKAVGGHLVAGNEIFVAEVCIAEFSGHPLERVEIPDLGLQLWRTD